MNNITYLKQQIQFGDDTSGISVVYIKSRNVLQVGGWYDHIAGIQSTEIPLPEFLDKLGVPKNKRG